MALPLAFLLAALGMAAPIAPEPAAPRKPNPLPEPRSSTCQDQCYMHQNGCDGVCRVLRNSEEQARVVVAPPTRIEHAPEALARPARVAIVAPPKPAPVWGTTATPKTLRRHARLAARANQGKP